MSNAWTTKDIPSQAGKRIIVTGANSGIGWHAALELARAGGNVTIASRNMTKAEDAARRIREIVRNADVRTGQFDLSDPQSVAAFAERELRGHPIEARTAPIAEDAAASHALFYELERITSLRYEF